MPLPRVLTYNDLDGEEIKHVLTERFQHLLSNVTYLQRHITLPRVRMTLMVSLDCWADQPTPEQRVIQDQVEIVSENAPPSTQGFMGGMDLQSTVDTSRRGNPPDQVREEHDLPIPRPVKGPLSIEDSVEGRRVTMDNGVIVDRTGNNPESAGRSTFVKQDFGPARNRTGQEQTPVRNNGRSGPAPEMVIHTEEELDNR